MPPLRERVDEIAGLVAAPSWRRRCRESARRVARACARRGDELPHGYGWPGNIRELKNVMERAFVLCDGTEIGTQHLPLEKMRRSADETTARRCDIRARTSYRW